MSNAAWRNQSPVQQFDSSAVTLIQFDTPSATHNLWTRAGIATSPTTPTWYLSLRDLVFSKSGEIGRGSFGTVYKGLWADTPVVIKFMGYEEDFDTISTELLLHEVRVWHRLSHPHVLKMYGACHIDKRYFVCEYASNGELNKYLKKPGNEHLMWEKLYEAALGLEYLHAQNVAHNDLKCDNILMGMDGKAKLIDFGLSCVLNEAEIQVDVTKMGAVNWRSPGMLMLEVLTCELPLGATVDAAVRRYARNGRLPLQPKCLNVSQWIMIQMMYETNPSLRVKIAFEVDKLYELWQSQQTLVQKAPAIATVVANSP